MLASGPHAHKKSERIRIVKEVVTTVIWRGNLLEQLGQRFRELLPARPLADPAAHIAGSKEILESDMAELQTIHGGDHKSCLAQHVVDNALPPIAHAGR